MHIYKYSNNPFITYNSKILKFLKTAANLVAKPKLTWPHLAALSSLFFNSFDVSINTSVEVSVCLITEYYIGACITRNTYRKMCP